MTTQRRLFHLEFLCFWVFIIGFGYFIHPTAASAATLPPGYQLSVTESASTMNYGDASPTFRAQLTVPADEPPVTNPANFYIQIDSQTYQGEITGLSSPYTLLVEGVGIPTPLPVGQHSVVAVYFSPKLGTTIESSPISLTVDKATPELACSIVNWANTYSTNAALTITLSFANTNAPVNWQDATYTVTFADKQTFNDTNLTANGSEQIIASTPSAPGNYQTTCTFNGTASFSSVESNMSVLAVSENHQPGGIKLYTNPTTLQAGQAASWYVVVSGTSGLPAPTGYISLHIGASYTKNIALGSGGSILFQANAPSPLASTITVFYDGDPVYTSSSANFSLTNPPIPTGNQQPTPTPTRSGSTGSGNAPGTSPSPTPIATVTSSALASSATPTSTTGTTNATLRNSNSTPSSSTQGNAMGWIWLVAIIVLVLAGGTVGFIIMRKRSANAQLNMDQQATAMLKTDQDM